MKNSFFKTLLIVLSVMLLLCSCTKEGDTEIFEGSFEDENAEYNLNGYNLVYYCCGDGDLRNYKKDTFFYDLVQKRIGEVEKEYNCTVEIRNSTSEIIKTMQAAASGGQYLGDAFSYVGDVLNDIAAAGLLVGMKSVSDVLDITDLNKWEGKYYHETIAYNDDLYGFIPGIWPEFSYSEIGHYLVLMEDNIAKLGGTDPRDYLENRQWVWETFRKCLKDFTRVTGEDTDIYAIPATVHEFPHMYLNSNGNHLVDFDSNGNIINGYTDARAYKAMQEARDVKEEYGYAIRPDGVPGSLAMTFSNSNNLLKNIAFTVENFGIVGPPSGPDVEPGYVYSEYSNIRPTSISIMTQDQTATALILNSIYEPFEGYETHEKIRNYMNESVFFDRRDCDVFFTMVEHTRYNYFHWNVYSYMSEYLEDGQTITQSIETLEHKLSFVIEKNITPCVKGIIAVYGSYN